MPTFEVTAPNGKKYRIEGETKEGALEALKAHLGDTGSMDAKKAMIDAARSGTLHVSDEANARVDAANEVAMKGMYESQIQSDPLRHQLTEVVQGVPFVGEYFDEAAGAVAGPQARDRIRSYSDAMETARPGQSAALGVAGGIVGSIPAAVAAAPALPALRGASAVGTTARAAGAGGILGGAEGAVTMAGRGESPEERLQNAKTGAAIGFGLGATIAGFAPWMAKGAKDLARRVRGTDMRVIADEFGLDPAAARVVRVALLNDDLDAAVTRIGSLGDDAVLADAGPATAALLNASSKTGGEALAVTRREVGERSAKVGARLTGKLDGILGKPSGIREAARDIAEASAPARARAYERAFSKPISYADDAGRAIEDVIARVPPKTMKSAIDEANEAMIEAGKKNLQIMASIGDDGAVTFAEMPNVEQLDQIKRALDKIGRETVDQFGRPTAQGTRARRLASDMRDAIGNAVPEYSRALKIGGDKIKEDQALDLGNRLLLRSTKLEEVKEFMSDGISKDARDAAIRGLRSSIEETLSNVRRTITDPDTDAREAMQLVKDISSRANMDKLRLVLGPTRADQLLKELDVQATVLALRGAVARNSDTAISQSIQGQVKVEAAPGMVRSTAGNVGNPLDAAKGITQRLAGIDPRSMSASERAIFADIAKALTQIKGAEARSALVEVQKALAGQPMKDKAAQTIGRLLSGSTSLGAYQTGQQYLMQPRPERRSIP